MSHYRIAGSTEQHLRKLWDRTRVAIYHPKNWLKLQRLKKRFDLEFIRYQDVKIKIPSGKIPDCETCVEICCTGPNSIVSLRLRDIAALIDYGLSDYITQDKSNLFVLGNNMSGAQKNFASSYFAQIFPVLSQDRTKTCKLLDENRMCKAYPHWPISCARYPYAIDPVHKIVFYAKGCTSFDIVSPYEASYQVRYLANAAIESYNERIKDILLIIFAKEELKKIGLTSYLKLDQVKHTFS